MLSEMNRAGWSFDNSYSRLPNIMFAETNPVPVKKPELIILNKSLLKKLELDFSKINKGVVASVLSGNLLPDGSKSIAQAYAGHQYGFFTMLGDGRALLLGEQINSKKERFDIQLKGSGPTPFSRGGDGRAALGPMLREYIISEAMHSLNIPTTRCLAAVKTGENIFREKLLPGAIITRVASSHIRVGTFQYTAMLGDKKNLKILLDYTVNRHYPEIKNNSNPALSLLKAVMKKQINLVVEWMRVGFIHGVMNTDNMSVCGETIDYGPCAFMDIYNSDTVFSSIDHNGRYSYKNQPSVAQWNLIQFAKTLLPLINDDNERAVNLVRKVFLEFEEIYKKKWLEMMGRKLGFFYKVDGDEILINDLLFWMEKNKADFTNTFYFLTYNNFLEQNNHKKKDIVIWYNKWRQRLKLNNGSSKKSIDMMKKNNPVVIPRNHLVEEVLEAANNCSDLKPLNNILEALKKPYIKKDNNFFYTRPPEIVNSNYKTFCGT